MCLTPSCYIDPGPSPHNVLCTPRIVDKGSRGLDVQTKFQREGPHVVLYSSQLRAGMSSTGLLGLSSMTMQPSVKGYISQKL